MRRVEVAIATYNQRVFSAVSLAQSFNEKTPVLIAHQLDDYALSARETAFVRRQLDAAANIRYRPLHTRGLAKSRNFAIGAAEGEYIWFLDDDVTIEPDCVEIIEKAIKDLRNPDVITFQTGKPEGGKRKNYKSLLHEHNWRSVLRISSVEVVVKSSFILSEHIVFDERFGLNGQYGSGEENIFICDCMNAGARAYYYPAEICKHAAVSSGMGIANETVAFSKGAVFKRMYGNYGLFFVLLFCRRKYEEISATMSIFKYLLCMMKGWKTLKR